MKNLAGFFLMVCLCTTSFGQVIEYDTTYQVTYENGVKDSVVIISKTITVKENVYIVDSTQHNRWAMDATLTPFFSALSSKSSFYSTGELTNLNKVYSHSGQAIGMNLYYHIKDFELRFGGQLSRHAIKISNEQNRYSQVSNTHWVNDTLDVYFSVDSENDTTYFYVIEPREEIQWSTAVAQQQARSSLLLYYLEFSLHAGYKMSYKNWLIHLYGGPVASFILTSKGESFSDTGESHPVREDKISSPVFSAQSSLQVGYNYTDQVQLYVEPYFQKYLFNINPSDVTLYNQDIMGCRMGMKIFL